MTILRAVAAAEAPSVQTAAEVAAEFRCSAKKIRDLAAAYGIGVNLRGSAGWRFDASDKRALWEAMRPTPAVPVRKRRRRKT